MKRVLAVVAVAMLCVACSHDDMPDVPATDAVTDTPIALRVGVAEETTRAGYPAGKLTEGTMGFYMTTAGANLQDTRYNAANRQLECCNGKWGAVGYPLLWRNATDEVSWQAYYPYSEENISDGIIPQIVPTNQDVGAFNDFLYGKGKTTGMTSANGIHVRLEHQMSKLIVKLIPGTDLGVVEFKSVVIGGMNTEWAFDILKGRWDINSSITTPSNISMLKDLNDASGKTFEAIILPLNPDQFSIDITTTDDRKFYYKRGNTDFKEGQVHSLNIQVGRDKVETAQMATAKWE